MRTAEGMSGLACRWLSGQRPDLPSRKYNIPNKMTNSNSQRDQAQSSSEAHNLHWQAFQYICGDLSPDESVAFEQILTTDQSAREAVAVAVELTQAVSAAKRPDIALPIRRSTETSDKNSRRWIAAGWMTVGAAVCLAVLFAINGLNSKAPSEQIAKPNLRSITGEQARTLALRWSEFQSSEFQTAADQDGLTFLGDVGQGLATADSTTNELGDHSIDLGDEDAAPAWLLSAVSRGAM